MLQSNNLQFRFILFIAFLVAAMYLNAALADPTPVTSALTTGPTLITEGQPAHIALTQHDDYSG